MSRPLVSIRMITYNQKYYICRAIESVLRQKTNFQYELLIGDDASTDGTADIVDSYQRKYPDVIKVFHREKNLGIRGNGHLLMQQCYGKYVAVLEGDDYWCCETKLQEQVDYLESHDNIIAVAHNVRSIDRNGRDLDDYYVDFPIQKTHIYDKRNAMRGEHFGYLSSILYRNIRYLLDKRQWREFLHCRLNGDLKLAITLGMLGDAVFFDNVWSIRRRVFKGKGWSADTYQKNLLYFYCCMNLEIKRYLKEVFEIEIDVSRNLMELLKKAYIMAIKSPTRENIDVARKISAAYIRYRCLSEEKP